MTEGTSEQSSSAALKPSDFVHLHNHTFHSVLDGLTKIHDLVDKVKELGMEAAAVTDHGTMSGILDYYKTAKKAGIKPIIGIETYVATRSRFDRDPGKDKQRFHLTVLAMNNTGFHNLMKLSTRANLEGMYYKPRIDREILKEHSEGLICLSGCLAGELARNIIEDYEKGKEVAKWYRDVFGDDYYLEIQANGIEEQKIVNQKIVKLSKELNIPLVVTNDVHYTCREDVEAQDILICIQTGKKIDDEDRMKIDVDTLYIKSPEEIKKEFANFPEALENTVKIAEKCNFEFEFGNTKLPNFDTPNGEKHEEYLKQKTYEGIVKKYGENYVENKEIVDRIKYELDVIIKMGYTDYFLIVWDFITYAKSQKIPVGPRKRFWSRLNCCICTRYNRY